MSVPRAGFLWAALRNENVPELKAASHDATKTRRGDVPGQVVLVGATRHKPRRRWVCEELWRHASRWCARRILYSGLGCVDERGCARSEHRKVPDDPCADDAVHAARPSPRRSSTPASDDEAHKSQLNSLLRPLSHVRVLDLPATLPQLAHERRARLQADPTHVQRPRPPGLGQRRQSLARPSRQSLARPSRAAPYAIEYEIGNVFVSPGPSACSTSCAVATWMRT